MASKTVQFLKIWRESLKIMFVFFVYHFIRDIFQDILNIHIPFIDILYYRADPDKFPSYLQWLNFGGYRKYYTLPIEILILLIIPKAIKQNGFTKIGGIIIVLTLFFVITWLLAIPYSTL